MGTFARLFLLLMGSVTTTRRPGYAIVPDTVEDVFTDDAVTFPAPHPCAALECEHTAPCWPCLTCMVDCSCTGCLQSINENRGRRHQAMVVLAQWAPSMTHDGLTMWARRAGIPPFPAHLHGLSRAEWIQVAAIEASEGRAVSPDQFPVGTAGWVAATVTAS